MNIDLQTIARQTGRTEAEIAKSIIKVLSIKAEVYGIPQRIQLRVRKEVNDGR